jgi:hypothetical protein
MFFTFGGLVIGLSFVAVVLAAGGVITLIQRTNAATPATADVTSDNTAA